jgi:hypothetical protein
MITFSSDPRRAEHQMHAVIFYLVTFGYIDGDFDAAERSTVREIIQRLIDHRAREAMPDAAADVRAEVVAKFTKHFHEVFEGIDQNVKDLFTESVSENEDPRAFVHTKLKVRCFEIFQSFDREGQEQLMALIDQLLLADGVAHPAEVQFRGELARLLETPIPAPPSIPQDRPSGPRVAVAAPVDPGSFSLDHPFFKPFEHHFSSNPDALKRQVDADRQLLDRALEVLEKQRQEGAGRLTGKHTVEELKGAFLDGHTYVRMPPPDTRTEITVLGDLHGCYSILKATVMQSRFFERVDAYRRSPKTEPFPLLVLLGDYIDRGRFSLNGVLRTVLQLFVTAPDHVVVLRGNHEYYVEVNGNMYGGVKPSEAINTMKPLLPIDVFRHYRTLFEQMPNVLLFDRMMFVHGGIPKDRAIKERWKDLSSLNDPDLRFQMMWSDPSSADVIPADLQDQASRFAFGRMQFRAFMQRLGTNTLVRGHEKIVEGFVASYDDEHGRLLTVFSAGGAENADLPDTSTYREVTPMALTITHDGREARVVPWSPDWRSYNDPERNAFFKVAPEIEHRT